mmetsp:Transcript_26064/g.82740  ORF Transcript_26064/g.82740 Transcript_26064/m.82740 type:complete len:302 (+) Transcript_26064:2902-3807(+)
MPVALTSVAQLAERYDAFLLDQFGVLHNGTTALPGAVECFAKLIAAGKRCVVLSNTSKRGGTGAAKLATMGFNADALSGFVASGELAWQYMAAEWRGKKAVWMGWDETNKDFVNGLELLLAPVGEADVVLCQGTQMISDGTNSTPIDLFVSGEIDPALSSVLDACVACGLPMVCCNPDFTALVAHGRGYMPGTLAREYERRGGTVISFGKPSTKAFEAGLELLGGIPKERVCHVGDSLHHDIAGANASGVDSLFVTTGIHADELELSEGATAVDDGALERVLAASGGHRPTHVTMRFRWEN